MEFLVQIIQYQDANHRGQVIQLWDMIFAYQAPHNDPALTIDKKLLKKDELFFVAEADGVVFGTAMAGYDGHRGWLYVIAVHPDSRSMGIGSALVKHAEQALAEKGCCKVNLQILSSNQTTSGFYEKLGYQVEPRISMGKLLDNKLPKTLLDN
jgi:ribosomal protein S18 acetylase RimI-like enzyme